MTRRVNFQMKHINGYKFFFIHKPNKTLHIEAIINSGFVHENKQNTGVNHLLEHILVSAWEECGKSCNDYLDKEGMYSNASTNDTTMKYYVKGNKEDESKMVEYISTIITKPLFRSSVMEQEKKAVQIELLEALNKPITKVYDTFHKHFFSTEGLQHAEDCYLQLKNLNHISLSTLKEAYEQFHVNNCLFIVYGDYTNAPSLFSKYLKTNKGKSLLPKSCFSFRHDIIHIPFQKESVTIYLGFPSKETTFFSEYIEFMLHHLLFHELRSIHKLVYDIDIHVLSSQCGTSVTFEFDVKPENASKTFYLLLQCLKKYQTILSDVKGVQKKMLYQYQKEYEVNYLSTFIYEKGFPLSKRQLLKKVKEFTPELFRNLCQTFCPLENALCVYQGEKIKIDYE